MFFHLEIYHKLNNGSYAIDFHTNDGQKAFIHRNHASPIINVTATKKRYFNQDKSVDRNHRFVHIQINQCQEMAYKYE